MFWHRLWLDCGRPSSGAVADSMRRTRVRYHYAIRKSKKDEDLIIRERVASAMLNGRTRDFWAEIKRMRGHRTCVSRVADGESEASSIAHLFAAKYRDLLSIVFLLRLTICMIYRVQLRSL